jgi:hypothetical protein
MRWAVTGSLLNFLLFLNVGHVNTTSRLQDPLLTAENDLPNTTGAPLNYTSPKR